MFGANRTAVNAEASLASGQRNFVPMAELRAQSEQITHYIIDHPDLPFEQLPPPRGLPPELADVVPGVPVDENALGGTHTHSRAKGYQAAAIGKGEEVTFDYLDLAHGEGGPPPSREQRRQMLRTNFGFECRCECRSGP